MAGGDLSPVDEGPMNPNAELERQVMDSESPPREEEPLPPQDTTRKLAEESATPLSFQNLLLRRYVEQTFQIRPDLELTFRSLSAGTGEFMFRQLTRKYENEWRIVFDEASRFYYVASSLQALNGNPIGGDLDEALLKSEETAEKVLADRVAAVKSYPGTLVALLYSHYLLFTQRVEDFIKGGDEEAKNS